MARSSALSEHMYVPVPFPFRARMLTISAQFPSEWGQRQKFVRAVHKPLDHKGNAYVTYSFILAHMVEQQHRHWCELSVSASGVPY